MTKLSFPEYSYCIDTNALIDLWRRLHPPDIFPSLWEKIEALIHDGRFIAPREVLNELEKVDDDLLKWAKKHRTIFRDLEIDQQEHVKDRLSIFPNLVDIDKTIPDADPFVIALAMTESSTVVTSERLAGPGGKPNIPNVCNT